MLHRLITIIIKKLREIFGQDLLLEAALHRQNLNNIYLSTSFPLHRLLNR